MGMRLPLLITIPHGGEIIPPEVRDRVQITAADVFLDGDPLTREIFDFGGRVAGMVAMPIARAIIDVNRAPHDRPPANPDGVVKTVTTTGTAVYREGRFPGGAVVEALIEGYHRPYHEQIEAMCRDPSILLGIDCHSMLPHAPPLSANPGSPRPLICISNGGDLQGNPTESVHSVTSPPALLRTFRETLFKSFGPEGPVRINDPFRGGYTIHHHSRKGPIPWIQLEINRRLYLTPLHLSGERLDVDMERIAVLRERLFRALEEFCERISDARNH